VVVCGSSGDEGVDVDVEEEDVEDAGDTRPAERLRRTWIVRGTPAVRGCLAGTLLVKDGERRLSVGAARGLMVGTAGVACAVLVTVVAVPVVMLRTLGRGSGRG
jgi:hypothetical protein